MTGQPAERRPSFVASAALLRTWSTHDWHGGILVDALSAFDRISVRTQNSTYHIVVVDPATADVLVRGGAFFPAYTPARLAGSSLGGSFLKLRSVQPGFRLELNSGDRCIVTSPVQTATLTPFVSHATNLM